MQTNQCTPRSATTLEELLASTKKQLNPLIANSVDEYIHFEDAQTELNPPRIGEYWQGQGGVYAGVIRDGKSQWHLIAATDRSAFIEGSHWGAHRENIPGEFSYRDGWRNTCLILAAQTHNKIASHFTALLIDGHKDFYWPSQCELNLLHTNTPEIIKKRCHWSSTQHSADTAWYQHFREGHQTVNEKHFPFSAKAVRRIQIK